jgi:hypothetical protein
MAPITAGLREFHPARPPGTAVLFSAMPAKRMNREEFFAKLSPLGEDGVAKVVWNLLWVPKTCAAWADALRDAVGPVT